MKTFWGVILDPLWPGGNEGDTYGGNKGQMFVYVCMTFCNYQALKR